MSMSRPGAIPKVPTLPAGDEVAAYPTYLQAQQAVDYLSDHKFPVENVTIVGTDLRMVERVTGRLTYGRVALAGVLSGAWFGLFVGLLLTLFAGNGGGGVLFVGIGLGAGFGLLFSVLSYAFTGGRRDFTSSSQIVAATYAILCAHDHASDARAMLLESPSGVGRPSGSPVPGAGRSGFGAAAQGSAASGVSDAGAGAMAGTPTGEQAPAETPPAPRKPDPRFVTPEGKPRYGAMRPEDDEKRPEPDERLGSDDPQNS
ncbi:general stress protein [Myceligenerans indicum]|uniref:general stress protein n=1 Tax=Myceligenerans indicum TaxID=2593663 RepID=UPI001FD348CF|nr:general stress protein [Myceligenerans indicum]